MVGFDDTETARYADAPLTTIKQLGRQAVERLIKTAGGGLAPELVVRRSCGCGHNIATPRFSGFFSSDETIPLEESLKQHRSNPKAELSNVAAKGDVEAEWISELVDAVIDSLEDKHFGKVSNFLQTTVPQGVSAGERPHTWISIISSLDRFLTQFVRPNTENCSRIETMVHYARCAVTDGITQVFADRNHVRAARSAAFNDVAAAILATLDKSDLSEAVPSISRVSASRPVLFRYLPQVKAQRPSSKNF